MTKHFGETLLHWFDIHGRKDLPWQSPRNAYRVWVSEIMLQQTQVKTAIPYFIRFLTSFPDVDALAKASEDEVLAHWSGLGYYSRARNLHKTAMIIKNDHQGEFPRELKTLIQCPGIGPSTAAAILSLAYDMSTAILDGNVKRVLSRYFLIGGDPQQRVTQQKLWQLANGCMPEKRCADYTQAIMDFGATCCTPKNPLCTNCPLKTSCLAHQTDVVSLYPEKKTKKPLPTKQEQFLLIHTSDDLIYLEKRPSNGLWGGLWCLPNIDIGASPTSYVQETYVLHTEEAQPLMSMKHSFSHFHLHIFALTLQTNTNINILSVAPGRWFKAHELSTLGLAKPVQIILNCFFTTRQT